MYKPYILVAILACASNCIRLRKSYMSIINCYEVGIENRFLVARMLVFDIMDKVIYNIK